MLHFVSSEDLFFADLRLLVSAILAILVTAENHRISSERSLSFWILGAIVEISNVQCNIATTSKMMGIGRYRRSSPLKLPVSSAHVDGYLGAANRSAWDWLCDPAAGSNDGFCRARGPERPSPPCYSFAPAAGARKKPKNDEVTARQLYPGRIS
ncbi:hypothetical protein ACFQAT_00240 [Undibacterium arcticum]|uniref:Uncharacterized protein n=1 Tax=Undibacterium arcticum TaxID=1762892 RepID=A0ABV7FAR6_9BURK